MRVNLRIDDNPLVSDVEKVVALGVIMEEMQKRLLNPSDKINIEIEMSSWR